VGNTLAEKGPATAKRQSYGLWQKKVLLPQSGKATGYRTVTEEYLNTIFKFTSPGYVRG